MIVELTEEECAYIAAWAQAFCGESYNINSLVDPPDQTPYIRAILVKLGQGDTELR
jgi:hypothetical protein